MYKPLYVMVIAAMIACTGLVAGAQEEEMMEGYEEVTGMVEEGAGTAEAAQGVIIADFEGWPNNLGGEVGVFGALEPNWDDITTVPYSWVYEAITPNYDPANVHSGNQSFRLVNGLGLNPELAWGSFAMDLGPTTDLTVIPKKVESFDASGYTFLTFWVKGEQGGEKMEMLMRDAHALNYMPQVKHKLPDATPEWQKITVDLTQFKGQIDLTMLDNIGIAFGRDVGNLKGEVIFVDDFMFTNAE